MISIRFRKAAIAGLAVTAIVSVQPGRAFADDPSDPRATFSAGNATTCSAVGLGTDSMAGTDNPSGDVSGSVELNAGSVQPGVGQEVDLTVTGPNVVIDAVVVKGGDGYNVYSSPADVDPLPPSPQHYISPLNGGGNVPTVSHWFVCFRADPAQMLPESGFAVLLPVGATGIFGLVWWWARRRRLTGSAG